MHFAQSRWANKSLQYWQRHAASLLPLKKKSVFTVNFVAVNKTLVTFAAECWPPCWCGYGSKSGRACCRRAVQQSIDISCRRARSSKPAARCCSGRIGQRVRRTDAQHYRRPCSACYGGEVNNFGSFPTGHSGPGGSPICLLVSPVAKLGFSVPGAEAMKCAPDLG